MWQIIFEIFLTEDWKDSVKDGGEERDFLQTKFIRKFQFDIIYEFRMFCEWAIVA
jgi:hypothetical protein